MKLCKIPFLLMVFFSAFMFGAQGPKAESNAPYNPVPDIMEHISDGHMWHFWGEGESATIMHLPVIIFDNGLKIFSSSRFGQHGDQVAKVDGAYYKMVHNKIYDTDAAGTIHKTGDVITNKAPFDVSITKVVLQMIIAALILAFIAFATRRSYKKGPVPSGVARFMEPIIIFVRDEIAIPTIGSVKYKKFVPYLVTLFLFLWLVNVMGLIPNSANISGNIAFTGILAVFTFIITQSVGTKTYWLHTFDPLGKDMSFFAKSAVYLILVPLEVLGLFTKPFALLIRLFANMTAGHIITLSLVSIIFIVKTVWVSPGSILLALFINVLDILITALQAYIFTILTSLYIGMAVETKHA